MTRRIRLPLALTALLAVPALAQDPKDLERFFAAGSQDWTRSSAEARPGVTEVGTGLSVADRYQASQLTTPTGGKITLVTSSQTGIAALASSLDGGRSSVLLAGSTSGLLQRLGVEGHESHLLWQPPPRLPIGILFFEDVPPEEAQRFLRELRVLPPEPAENEVDAVEEPKPVTRPNRVVRTNGMSQALESETAPVATPSTSDTAPIDSSETPVAIETETAPDDSNLDGVAPVDSRGETRKHTIERGETLYAIARKHGITTTELALANGIPPGKSRILEGKELVIPAKAARRDRVVMKDGKKQHWIQEGDTPARVAKLYGVSIAELRAANPGARLRAGSLLVLPEGAKVPETVTAVD